MSTADGKAHPGSRRARLRAWVEGTFTDRLMAELALLIVPTTVLPMIYSFSPVLLQSFAAVNVLVILAFVAEYVLKLYVAESRGRFFVDPWHLLDLLIVLLAAADFLPFIPWQGGRASPLLRLFRLARFFAVTGRILGRVGGQAAPEAAAPPPARTRISVLEEGSLKRDVSWPEAVVAVNDPRATWLDVQHVSRADLAALSETFRVPQHILASKLFGKSFPAVDYFRGFSVFVLWDSRLASPGEGDLSAKTEEAGLVVICGHDYLATLSVGECPLFEQLVQTGLPLEGEGFGVRVLYAILQRKIGDYKDILQCLEQRVAAIEDIPIGEVPKGFLEDTFALKKQIQRQDYNVRHFVQVLSQVRNRKVMLQDIRDESLENFVLLHDEAETLNDICHTTRENLLSAIELQLNKVSFDLNRVMRILAVITCLAIVPAVIGGLLGENLVDQPYNMTIHEVFFVVIALMLIGLYVFYRKGWMK